MNASGVTINGMPCDLHRGHTHFLKEESSPLRRRMNNGKGHLPTLRDPVRALNRECVVRARRA